MGGKKLAGRGDKDILMKMEREMRGREEPRGNGGGRMHIQREKKHGVQRVLTVAERRENLHCVRAKRWNQAPNTKQHIRVL